MFLIDFNHGLGDNVQLISILDQLSFEAKVLTEPEKYSIYSPGRALARNYHSTDEYKLIQVGWPEPSPTEHICSKMDLCLGHDAIRRPYSIHIPQRCTDIVESHFANYGKLCLTHYLGRSGSRNKDVSNFEMDLILKKLKGYTVIVMDYENRCHLQGVEKAPILGVMDAGITAAMIARADLFIGIDSGPGHLAACTDTPSIIIWRWHNPLNYYCPYAKNVMHFLPQGTKITEDLIKYFNYRVYNEISASIEEYLNAGVDKV